MSSTLDKIGQQNPAPMVVGLAVLIAAMIWPGLPVVTAMALVTLGTTGVTLARFRGTAAIFSVALVHLVTYGGLYSLFVGASLHAAATQPRTGLQTLVAVDLAASIGPLGITLERVWCELRGGGLTG